MRRKLAILVLALFVGAISAGPAFAGPADDGGWGGDPPCLHDNGLIVIGK